MRKLVRNLIFAALTLLAFVCQLTFGARLALPGAAPELLPALAAAAGVIAGKTVGAWCGFLGGLQKRKTNL